MVDITKYQTLITSEHADKPNYMALVSAVAQCFVDIQNLIASMPGLFDLDIAVGQQLDVVGQWVGISRQLEVPLIGIYFSLDTANLGFDQGTWKGPFDPTTGLVSLPDDAYRTLIRAKIAANNWDGTAEGALAAYQKLFPGGSPEIVVFDHVDMTMSLAIIGPLPDAVTLALFTNGLLNLRPSGVDINGYFIPSITSTPFFGFDCENAVVSGFDVGCWPTDISS